MGLLCLLWDQTGLEREVVKSGLMCLIVTGMKQNSQNVPSLHGVELNVLIDEILESSALLSLFDFESVVTEKFMNVFYKHYFIGSLFLNTIQVPLWLFMMVWCGCLERDSVRGSWKFSSIRSEGEFCLTPGVSLNPLWSADSWAEALC